MNGSVSGPRGVARLPTQQLVGPRLCLGAFPRRTLVVARGLCDGLWSLDGKLLPRRCRRTIVTMYWIMLSHLSWKFFMPSALVPSFIATSASVTPIVHSA